MTTLRERAALLITPQTALGMSLFVKMYVLATATTVSLGALILYGREERFQDPVFDSARALVGWVPYLPAWLIWGLAFIAGGALLVYSLGRQLAVLALRMGVYINGFFVLGLVDAMVSGSLVSWALALTVIGQAYMYLMLATHLHRWGWVS